MNSLTSQQGTLSVSDRHVERSVTELIQNYLELVTKGECLAFSNGELGSFCLGCH
jgi:hypothetical protein